MVINSFDLVASDLERGLVKTVCHMNCDSIDCFRQCFCDARVDLLYGMDIIVRIYNSEAYNTLNQNVRTCVCSNVEDTREPTRDDLHAASCQRLRNGKKYQGAWAFTAGHTRCCTGTAWRLTSESLFCVEVEKKELRCFKIP